MEIGWVLLREHWGKGYASILTKQMITEAGNQGKSLVIECDPAQKFTSSCWAWKTEAIAYMCGNYGRNMMKNRRR